ncbi:hypothetical protein [Actinacidiphila epipremni]|jgi:hypothetical protein|uniref:Uncharacterized protein n=1 Tax=Actinacidiphila epipremni TaxID=2053013 RepID=A0ABX0ZLZ0_9ACTN|nr:hypothetical protein [Actinacidiphila epipremni]NJP44055.1 hypothetical protein [Actinacidiphila epipremni]
MNFEVRKKGIALVATVAAVSGLALTAGTVNASAATPKAVAPAASGILTVPIYNGSTWLGDFEWSANPNGSNPGDAFRVRDTVADGVGLRAELLTNPVRVATTAGHNSPYTSPWNTGNLTEGSKWTVYVYSTKGGVLTYRTTLTVTA